MHIPKKRKLCSTYCCDILSKSGFSWLKFHIPIVMYIEGFRCYSVVYILQYATLLHRYYYCICIVHGLFVPYSCNVMDSHKTMSKPAFYLKMSCSKSGIWKCLFNIPFLNTLALVFVTVHSLGMYRLYPHIVNVCLSVLVCGQYLCQLNQSTTIEHRYHTVAFLYLEELWLHLISLICEL